MGNNLTIRIKQGQCFAVIDDTGLSNLTWMVDFNKKTSITCETVELAERLVLMLKESIVDLEAVIVECKNNQMKIAKGATTD